jgi:sulfonate transport system permease protein
MIIDVGLSVLRWFLGLLFGGLAGLSLLALCQISSTSRWLGHLLNFMRAIPIIGLVPLVQMHIGVREYGKIGLIAWGVMFPVWLTISAAVSRNLPEAELMLRGAQASRTTIRRVLIWPKFLGGTILGVEIGIGLAWLCVVAAEWIGTYTQGFWAGGLGYRLIVSYQNNDWHRLYLALFIFGVLGTSSAYGWKCLIRFAVMRSDGFDPVRWLRQG